MKSNQPRGTQQFTQDAADKAEGMTAAELLEVLAAIPESVRAQTRVRVDVGFRGQIRTVKISRVA